MKKKIISILAIVLCTMGASAQVVVSSEMESYAVQKYGDNWQLTAGMLVSKQPLVDGQVEYTEVIEMPGKTRQQLYSIMETWMVKMFPDAVTMIDPAGGVLVARDHVFNVTERMVGLRKAYVLSINPEVRIDVKDGRVRVMCTTGYYNISRTGGVAGKTVNNVFRTGAPKDNEEVWAIRSNFPFTNDHEIHCAKAFVKTTAYGPLLAQKVRSALEKASAAEW